MVYGDIVSIPLKPDFNPFVSCSTNASKAAFVASVELAYPMLHICFQRLSGIQTLILCFSSEGIGRN